MMQFDAVTSPHFYLPDRGAYLLFFILTNILLFHVSMPDESANLNSVEWADLKVWSQAKLA